MNYFLDTEFHHYIEKPFFSRKAYQLVELISIAIIAEDGRELSLVSKDFNLKQAWNNNWIRENVLKKIHTELCAKEGSYTKTYHWNLMDWSYKGMRNLLDWHGTHKDDIAEKITQFCKPNHARAIKAGIDAIIGNIDHPIVFYGHFSDFDYCILSNLYGSFEKWPLGFPMYIRDLQQTLEEKVEHFAKKSGRSIDEIYDTLKNVKEFPKSINEHNALYDARHVKNLYKFLQTLQD